jgi:succinate-semialdehyde dehydrogenase / glutarate-semialdehyde dehydrogenase
MEEEQVTIQAEAPGTVTLRKHAIPVGLYINGAWRQAGAAFPVVNPATGQEIARVADGTADDALLALDAAAGAQAAWRAVPPRQRASLFHQAHRLLTERAEAIAETMTLESGKPLAESRAEFQLSADFFLWYTEQIAHLHGTYADGSNGGYRVVTAYQPVGPSLLITPWNFPLLMIARKAGAALAAGCTVVVKSAKETPLTCALFTEVLHDAGFPAGVVNLVHTTTSSAVSAAVMADRRLRKVSFTGSTEVGATLLGHAAPGIVNASMELGGDGPFVVLDDADLDLAAEQAVICKFRNAGQACVAANRIIVQDAVADAFTEKFLAATARLRVGDGFDPGVTVGPIISIYRVGSAAEAVEFANDTRYGLAAYVFTRDISRAIALSEHLDFGMVGINRGIMADPAAAFGGVKASGLGREGGHKAIYEFLEPKYLAITVDEKAALAS